MMKIAMAGLILTAPLAGCGADPCNNEVLVRAKAPDGRVEAVLFKRACGATTGDSEQVSILKPGQQPKGGGNVFVADSDHGAAPSGPLTTLRWPSTNELIIRHDGRARIFKKAAHVETSGITYEQIIAVTP
jgi:hypothetical protein